MALFILCIIIIPNVVFGMNSTNNITNISLQENVTAEIYNTSFSELLTTKLSHTTTKQLAKRMIHNMRPAKKPVKPKSKNIKKTKNAKQKEISNMQKVVKPIKRDLEDMPMKSDLEQFFASLHSVLDFFLENKNDVDLSLSYGLFLLNVNLRTVLKEKHNSLPPGISFNLKHVLEKNDELLNFFKKMVMEDNAPEDELSKILTTLFNHDRLWMFRIQKFDGSHVNETVYLEYTPLEYHYSNWDKYTDRVGDFNLAQPRPDQSDRCLSFLADNHANKDSIKRACKLPNQCRTPLAKGSDYGYGLTHRLLFLQLAYYGHRCYVFSNKQDEKMRNNFCKMLYSEASYISMNDYETIDLFVEQLCLCALDGHYEFLRRSWLLTIIDYQTSEGCFSDVSSEKRPQKPQYDSAVRRNWRIDKGENQYILGGLCNVHTSAAAAATLAFGVKFILEAYY